MQSAKKTTKILSALSMAAAAVFASKAAHGATLSLYYGQDNPTASNNSVMIGTGYAPTGTGNLAANGADQYFNSSTGVVIAPVGTTTITLPVGDYLSLAIDAVLTGNTNPDGNKSTGPTTKAANHATQPVNLGLASMGAQVFSSDTNGTALTPLGESGAVSTAANGGTTYFSTGILNNAGGAGGTTKQGPNLVGTGAYNVVPNWVSLTSTGDVEPNQPGFDQGTKASGNIFINSPIFGGITSGTTGGTSESASNTSTGIQQLEQFATSNNVASYSNATDFVDSLIYQGLTAGTVTLTGAANTASVSYWTLTTAGTSTSLSQYKNTPLGSGDTVNGLPLLVIDVVGTTSPVTGHAIVNLADTAADNTNYPGGVTGTFSPSTSPTLTVMGGHGGYTVAQVTGINGGAGDSVGNVPVTSWNPTTDAEIYGVDVKVNGSQATAGQLAALILAIDGADTSLDPTSLGVVATTTDPSHGQVLAALDTGTTTYNLFLDFPAGGPSGTDDLGLDFSSTNDSNLSGYTFTAISVVPEPMSLSLLALGGIGLMGRRNRRKA